MRTPEREKQNHTNEIRTTLPSLPREGRGSKESQQDSDRLPCLKHHKKGVVPEKASVRACCPLSGFARESCRCSVRLGDEGQWLNSPISLIAHHALILWICPNSPGSKGQLQLLFGAAILKAFLLFFPASESFLGPVLWGLGEVWAPRRSADTGPLQTVNTSRSRGPGAGRGQKRRNNE